jgi:hypothetical protein
MGPWFFKHEFAVCLLNSPTPQDAEVLGTGYETNTRKWAE